MTTNPYRDARSAAGNAGVITVKQVTQSVSHTQQIINELIAGRLKLLEATALFQAAHHPAAACVARATGQPMASTDGENLCRTVIGWVYLTLSHRPEQAERVSASLEHELQRFLSNHGKVDLSTTI